MKDAIFTYIPLGAILQSFRVKGLNIVLNFDLPEQYAKYNDPCFGETIGRVANRISNATIDSLNGKSYALANNEGKTPNNIHGGTVGWGKRTWNGPKAIGDRQIPGIPSLLGGESVEFTLTSEDGDEGFPGTVAVKVIYTSGRQKGFVNGRDVTVLGIDLEAKLVDGAEETAVNMTNHSYFNISGGPTTEGSFVTVGSNEYLPVDKYNIPIDGPQPYHFDTTKKFQVTSTGPDIDSCFIINKNPSTVPIDTRSSPLNLCVEAHHPGTGIHLQVLSTEPAFQLYMGHWMDVPAVDGLPARGPRSGFACEPGRYVNAINEEAWKPMVLLRKGQTYGSRIVYRAWADEGEE